MQADTCRHSRQPILSDKGRIRLTKVILKLIGLISENEALLCLDSTKSLGECSALCTDSAEGHAEKSSPHTCVDVSKRVRERCWRHPSDLEGLRVRYCGGHHLSLGSAPFSLSETYE